MNRIIITGVLGNLGKDLSKKLLDNGYYVIGIDRYHNKQEEIKEEKKEIKEEEIKEKEIKQEEIKQEEKKEKEKKEVKIKKETDFEKTEICHSFIEIDLKNILYEDSLESVKLKNILKKDDIFIHLAAILPGNHSHREYYLINYKVTSKLCELAKEAGISKVIFLSTTGVYSVKKDNYNIKEENIKNVDIHPYVKSKFLAEKEILKLDGGTVLRAPAIISKDDKFILPQFIKANNSYGVPLIKNGKHKLSVIDKEKLISYILIVINSKNSFSGVYNLTNSVSLTYKELVDTILFDKVSGDIKYLSINQYLIRFIATIFDVLSIITKRSYKLNSFNLLSLMYGQVLNDDKFILKIKSNSKT